MVEACWRIALQCRVGGVVSFGGDFGRGLGQGREDANAIKRGHFKSHNIS